MERESPNESGGCEADKTTPISGSAETSECRRTVFRQVENVNTSNLCELLLNEADIY